MFLVAVGTSIAALVLWCFIKRDPPPLYGIYAQPGRWFTIKKFIFKTLVKLRKRRQQNEDGEKRSSGYGVKAHRMDADMEKAQTLSSHPQAIDSAYFNGFNSDGAALILRICRRHGRQIELWMLLDLPGLGIYQAPMHPDTLVCDVDGSTISGGGLRFECLEPMRRWRITFNGLLRENLCNDWKEKDNNKVVHVKFSFIWEAFSNPFDFDTDIHPEAISSAISRETWSRQYFNTLKERHQTHYEQWGEMRGVVKVEEQEERKLILKSVRDHSFGVRDWHSFYRYATHFLYLKDGTTFNASVVSLPGAISYLQCGYLLRPNGLQMAVPFVDLDLPNLGHDGTPPNEYSFNFEAGGKHYHVEVKTRYAPQYYHHEDWRSMVYEKLVDIKVNGEEGYGIAEWLYRYPHGSPVPTKHSTLLLKEPDCNDDVDFSRLSLTFTEPACCSSQLVGGKGCQLAMLTQMESKNFQVPSGFCLTLAAFECHLESNPLIEDGIEQLQEVSSSEKKCGLSEACEAVVAAFLATSLSEVLQEEISSSVEEVFGDNDGEMLFAVRSSAAGEDSADMSAAGQMDTILGVNGRQQMYAAVIKCWSSHFALVAVQYRRQHGQPIRSPMAVVIQQMAPATAAGVLFTLDPVTGNPGMITINANYGLGESVVSGCSEPDLIQVSRTWDNKLTIASQHLGSKKTQITLKEGGGVVEKDVQSDAASHCCLHDDVVLRLSEIGVELEKRFSDPRDVEWAVDKENTIYLLQARPITTLHQETEWELLHEFDTPLATDGKELLTTANIGEMMPGAITPLTHSVFLRAIENSGQVLLLHSGIHDNLYSSFRFMGTTCNTAFINLHWIAGAYERTVLGTSKSVLGLNLCGEPLEDFSVDECEIYNGAFSFWRRLKNSNKLRKHFKSAHEKTQAWEKILEDYSLVDLHHESAAHLYEHICRDMSKYNQTWNDTIANSGQSGAWASILMSVLSKGKPEWTSDHYSDVSLLLAKCDKVESADVPAALQEMAEVIRCNGNATKVTSMSPEEAVVWLKSPESGEVGCKFETFLKRHGHRCIREAEFRELSWQSAPFRLVAVLQAMLSSPVSTHTTQANNVTVKECISRLKTPLSLVGKLVLRWAVPKARRDVGAREWGKSISIKMVEVFKQAYWKLGEMMRMEGRLPDGDLIFFLTHLEIGQLLDLRSGKLVAKAQKRRQVLKKQSEMSFPRMNRGHPVPIDDTLKDQITLTASLQVKGMPVSQGEVTGVARVITCLQDASSIQPSDILIVPYTDVGWSPYFPLISGLVTEIGGLISHGAVVAREYGLPCIVNVPHATTLFKTGDRVCLSGTEGTLMKLE